MKVRVKKNRMASPHRECIFELHFGYGIEDLLSCAAWLLEAEELESIGYTMTQIQNISQKGSDEEIQAGSGKSGNQGGRIMESDRSRVRSPSGQIRTTRIVKVRAECLTCGQTWIAKNAMLAGANHSRHSGVGGRPCHEVVCTQVLEVRWGEPTRREEGML